MCVTALLSSIQHYPDENFAGKVLESNLINSCLLHVVHNTKLNLKLLPTELSDKVIKIRPLQEEVTRFFSNDEEWHFYSSNHIIFFTDQYLDSGERLIFHERKRGTRYYSIEIKFHEKNVTTYVKKKISNFLDRNIVWLLLFALVFTYIIIKR